MTKPILTRKPRGPSDRLLRALERIRNGSSPYQAARDEGLTPGAIYRSPAYRKIRGPVCSSCGKPR